MRRAAVLLLLLSQIGCAALEPRAPVVRPSLSLDQTPLPGIVRNATPPKYGLGESGGCMTMAEFRIELTDLAIAEDGRLRIVGTILDADPQRQRGPLFGARIGRYAGGTRVPVRNNGQHINVLVEVDEGALLVVELLAYRALYLDLTRLAAVARRRAAAGAVAVRDNQ
jgi:hypothetical protein